MRIRSLHLLAPAMALAIMIPARPSAPKPPSAPKAPVTSGRLPREASTPRVAAM